MSLFNVIAVIDSWEAVRIYDATGAEDDKDFKCIYSGMVENMDYTVDLADYIVERIALDEPFINIVAVKKGC